MPLDCAPWTQPTIKMALNVFGKRHRDTLTASVVAPSYRFASFHVLFCKGNLRQSSVAFIEFVCVFHHSTTIDILIAAT